MDKKVNPIILRLGKTANWKSQYFEKKSSESSIYAFRNLEIENFIIQFFKKNGLTAQNTKLYYFDNTLHIFVSYFLTLKAASIVRLITKNQRIRFTNRFSKLKKKEFRRRLKIKRMIGNYSINKAVTYWKDLHEKTEFDEFVDQFFKVVVLKKMKMMTTLRTRRTPLLKDYKRYLSLKEATNKHELPAFFFKKSLLKSISKFIQKQTNVSITLQQLNNDSIKKKISEKEQKILQKSLTKLRKFNQNKFFKEGIVILLTFVRINNSELLAKFVATELTNLKRHHFFLNFIKQTLELFYNRDYSNCKGIKIQVKGRFNGAPRAKRRLISIGKKIPALTINSKLNYAENTSFTPNGTFGVKVWVSKKTN